MSFNAKKIKTPGLIFYNFGLTASDTQEIRVFSQKVTSTGSPAVLLDNKKRFIFLPIINLTPVTIQTSVKLKVIPVAVLVYKNLISISSIKKFLVADLSFTQNLNYNYFFEIYKSLFYYPPQSYINNMLKSLNAYHNAAYKK